MSFRILLADDHQIVREGIKSLLEQKGFSVVAEASEGHEAIRLAKELHPDAAVLDRNQRRQGNTSRLPENEDNPSDHAHG